jgi:hypothetical protein
VAELQVGVVVFEDGQPHEVKERPVTFERGPDPGAGSLQIGEDDATVWISDVGELVKLLSESAS